MITLYDYHFDDNYPFAMTGSHVYITTFYDYHFAMRLHTHAYLPPVYLRILHAHACIPHVYFRIYNAHTRVLTYEYTKHMCIYVYMMHSSFFEFIFICFIFVLVLIDHTFC